MSYSRKQFDKQKLKKLAKECCGFIAGSYFSKSKQCYIRFWKSRGRTSRYSFYKKYYHKHMRRFANKNYWYSKKEFDLIWYCW